MKRPVIIDTDLTLDDAVALAIASKSEDIEIKAVTTVGENKYRINQISASISKAFDMCCQTGTGGVKPVFKDEFNTDDVYGEYTIYDGVLPKCEDKDNGYAWDIIRAEAEKVEGNLEILTLGPVTNIAIAILRYPHIKPMIKQIFVVAGAGYTGNAAPYSEYNAYCDPDALQIVFDSGIPVVLCPLEALENCGLDAEKLFCKDFENKTVKSLFEVYKNNKQLCINDKIVINSAVAASAFINSAYETKDYFAACETRTGENQGWTIIDRLGKYKKEPNIKVVTKINKEDLGKTISEL